MRLCIQDTCNRQSKARGYCLMHYKRYMKNGDANITRTQKHGLTGTPIYSTWQGMMRRCYDKNLSSYQSYGGRGIKVCDRWFVLENFYKDMGERPEGLTLDRIDNDGDYTPDNCRWASRTTQSINQRLRIDNTSGYKGVRKIKNRWIARISVNGNYKLLGYFKTLDGAVTARKRAEQEYFKIGVDTKNG